jgi:hypothetical protein
MQAITTKYLPATNTKGARIKASCAARSIIVPYTYSDEPHRAAALALITRLGWLGHGEWHEGDLPDGKGSVFVCVGKLERPLHAVLDSAD